MTMNMRNIMRWQLHGERHSNLVKQLCGFFLFSKLFCYGYTWILWIDLNMTSMILLQEVLGSIVKWSRICCEKKLDLKSRIGVVERSWYQVH